VFENRVLRRIFGPKRYKVTGEWRKLHNEELYDLYCTPNIFRVLESRTMRWAGDVACIREKRDVYMVWWGTLRGRVSLGDPRLDEKLILRCIFRKWDVGVWTGSSWLRIGTVGGHL
jgi:hypothetical protein